MNTTPEQRRAENDLRVASDIATYGCHVVNVFDPDQKLPSFSYSVGIQATSGAPEAIVIGVRPDLGHSMVNEYNDQVRNGARFARGTKYDGFLKGFSIYIEPAKPDLLLDYMLGCTRFYQGARYAAVQLIYPTTSGVWPWQKTADAWFRSNQPLLGRAHPYRR
ncbi:MAG: DUF4262 domain-containing protein [Proteobacteria bacterium]|nr:DUF4262 domain-containing protein [Pseudomonadota bacterium]